MDGIKKSKTKTPRKPTHCSWLRPSGPDSPCVRHTSRGCGCTSHLHTGTRGPCSELSCRALPHSSPATRQTHRHNPVLHRSATGPAHTPSCCTGRNDCCKWVLGRKPHRSRLNSRCPCHKWRRWIYTGHWHIETRQPCIVWPLVSRKRERGGVIVTLRREVDHNFTPKTTQQWSYLLL